MMLESHKRLLAKILVAGDKGITASKLIPIREYREKVIKYLESEGLVRIKYGGGGMRVFLTEKGRKIAKAYLSQNPEIVAS